MLSKSDRQYIHAINILAAAKIGALAEIEQKFEGENHIHSKLSPNLAQIAIMNDEQEDEPIQNIDLE